MKVSVELKKEEDSTGTANFRAEFLTHGETEAWTGEDPCSSEFVVETRPHWGSCLRSNLDSCEN